MQRSRDHALHDIKPRIVEKYTSQIRPLGESTETVDDVHAGPGLRMPSKCRTRQPSRSWPWKTCDLQGPWQAGISQTGHLATSRESVNFCDRWSSVPSMRSESSTAIQSSRSQAATGEPCGCIGWGRNAAVLGRAETLRHPSICVELRLLRCSSVVLPVLHTRKAVARAGLREELSGFRSGT